MSVNKLQNTDSLSQWATKINDLVDEVADVKDSGLFVPGATYSPGDLITYDNLDNRWETKELIGLITFDPSYGATGPQIKYNINPSALTEIVGPDSGDLLLAYDASGATMVTLPTNSVTTPPGGTEFEIQYNNGSNGFAGATGFVYDPANSRVGINKNPSYALDVLGDINATSTIRLGGDQIITSSKNIDNVVNINATGDLTLGGNLELGTVSGTPCKLEVGGEICSYDAGSGGIKGIFHADGVAGKVFIGSQSNHPVGLIQGSSEYATLESGTFTVGATSAVFSGTVTGSTSAVFSGTVTGSALTTSGAVSAGSLTINSKSLTLSGNTTIGSSTDTVAFVTSGNTSVTLPTSGTLLTDSVTTLSSLTSVGILTNLQTTSLGVGTAASGTSGEIRATNNITAYYSSDSRLKENVNLIEDALGKLSKINGVSFDWTDDYINHHGGEDGFFIRKHDVGVIAQEIKEVLPEVVAQREDGYLAVKYDRIIPLLIQAIKELQEKVETLEAGK